MVFHDVQLSEEIERGAQGGPEFRTTVLELSSGFEQRNINWSRTRGSWDISYGLDKKSNQEQVLAFFYARQGKAHTFRFKDWTDFEIGTTTPEVVQEIAVGDAVEDRFQIIRRYSSGGFIFDREITRPVVGTVRVFLDSVEQVSGFTVDNSTGVVDFTVAPGVSVSVGIICEFDNPVRFDTDRLDLRAFFNGDFSVPAIVIKEVREVLAVL